MTTYVIRRLGQVLFVLWGAMTLVFVLYFMLPGDPAAIIAGGNDRNPDPEVVANVAARYGLDDPIPVQYVRYLGRLLQFDLGESYRDGSRVSSVIARTAPASIRLATWAILVEVTVGITLGVRSARRKRSLTDSATTVTAAVLSAVPVFVLAMLLQQVTGVYAFQHDWPEWAQFPVQGIGPDEWVLGIIPTAEQFEYLAQPVLVLASVSTIIVARLTRTTMLEENAADYIRTGRAKGLTDRRLAYRHALPNAMIPVTTFIGIEFGTLFGAAVLTEYSFNWPGLGSRIVAAADGRDLPMMIGLTLVVVLGYSLTSLAVDLSYARLDPRVRLEGDRR